LASKINILKGYPQKGVTSRRGRGDLMRHAYKGEISDGGCLLEGAFGKLKVCRKVNQNAIHTIVNAKMRILHPE
jgi:hypothetical protein